MRYRASRYLSALIFALSRFALLERLDRAPLALENLQHSLRRTADGGLAAIHHDGTLDQDGISHHQRDQRVVVEFAILQAKLGKAGLALAQEIARGEPERLEDCLELRREGGVFR